MVRGNGNEGQKSHSIRIPGSIIDKVKENGSYDENDLRFSLLKTKRKRDNITRKERRQQERHQKKQRRSKNGGYNHLKPVSSSHRKYSSSASAMKKINAGDGATFGTESDEILDSFEDLEAENEQFSSLSDEFEEDPIEQLRKIKEMKLIKIRNDANDKKTVKGNKQEHMKGDRVSVQPEYLDKDNEEIEYYAKKLGLKGGKNARLTKTNDDDLIGGILDGLELEIPENELNDELSDRNLSSNDLFQDFDSDNDLHDQTDDEIEPSRKENPFVAPIESTTTLESGLELKQRYVPPALRKKMELEKDFQNDDKLNKQIKSAINKLSEANIASIVNEINGLFSQYSRRAVTESLVNELLDSVIQEGRILDSFLTLYATVVVTIKRLQGIEFGAHFIQELIKLFDVCRIEEGSSKKASNLVSFLSATYALNLVSSKLLFDVVKDLIGSFNELNVEILLRLIRTSGNQMRIDDPNALKEIIALVNTVSTHSIRENTRMSFLIDTISSLKNNKLKTTNEHTLHLTTRMRKYLSSFKGHNLDAPIQVSLDDIRNVDSRGKWWLVGAAWKGQEETIVPDVNQSAINDILDSAEPNWMNLARSQRMNTDIRRAIFIAIMSASDYVDGLTKLEKLSLKRSQAREIPKVLLHCTGVEPAWNPYYALLASKLCNSHSYRKTFQFILWDLLKDLENSDSESYSDFMGLGENEDEETKLKKILNGGRFFGYMLSEGSLNLHVLRVVNFLTASEDTTLFLEAVFVTFIDRIAKKSLISSVGSGIVDTSNYKKGSTYHDKILIEMLLKQKDQHSLLRGIKYFCSRRVSESNLVTSKSQRKRVHWGVGSIIDIVDEFLKYSNQV
ncbi:uncharacterized protein PRCAT00001665001 [Priceomyces carsonii]|uniref:uncharacterized protein n=1 Tax=Priceomyces carsonii TaxID=28549 RepID=UPI002ED7CE64|nr:unnamed protein product [Priceomyces carsonii]